NDTDSTVSNLPPAVLAAAGLDGAWRRLRGGRADTSLGCHLVGVMFGATCAYDTPAYSRADTRSGFVLTPRAGCQVTPLRGVMTAGLLTPVAGLWVTPAEGCQHAGEGNGRADTRRGGRSE